MLSFKGEFSCNGCFKDRGKLQITGLPPPQRIPMKMGKKAEFNRGMFKTIHPVAGKCLSLEVASVKYWENENSFYCNWWKRNA
jgi:hypothetical protein